LVALGSYGREQLCPASDVDVLLLHGAPRRREDDVRALAERLWYPLWDAGFVTGHATRTPKESLALADTDLDALTALLEARHVAGDASVTEGVVAGARRLAERRRNRVVAALADAATLRELRPGPVAEMLEPDLKDGAGGLRDVQALHWAGWTLGVPGDLDALERDGYLSGEDRWRLDAAVPRLLDVRVALHRVTGRKSDRLALQDQDAVAVAVGAADADALVRDLAGVAREVAWIARDTWSRLRELLSPPSRIGVGRDRVVAEGVVVRDGRVTVTGEVDVLTVLEAAVAAAEEGRPFDRPTLTKLASMPTPDWDVWQRAAFLRLLRAGAGAVPAFEALDHAGVLVRLLPEWAEVRSRPQRNAYHRHTVDRHLLEAVSECADLLDAADAVPNGDGGEAFDAVIASACRRPELLLLAALLHDIGKAGDDDHSAAGAAIAADVARRIGLDSEGREILVWLVRHHLLMADTATRRDLSEVAVVDRFADACAGDAERLRLLYLLTVGDSRATGPAAWSRTKAALLRDLFVKAAAVIEERGSTALAAARRFALAERVGETAAAAHLDALPDSYLMAFEADEMAGHLRLLGGALPGVECSTGADGRPVVTVAAPDRPGLLATLAGALTVAGLSVREAFLFSTDGGVALDVFRAVDPFGRFADGGAARVRGLVLDALAGRVDIEGGVRDRRFAYRRPGEAGPVDIRIDAEESPTATIIEVEADDDVGALYELAAGLAAVGLDVSVAKVLTLGDRIVDTFYVREADGEKLSHPVRIDRVRSALADRLRPTP
jgi:[protein-PII] uridylyltransferase